MNVAELREALELFRTAPWDYHDTINEDTVVDAARELLTIREAGALIKWLLSPNALARVMTAAPNMTPERIVAILDALRDAKPPEGTK